MFKKILSESVIKNNAVIISIIRRCKQKVTTKLQKSTKKLHKMSTRSVIKPSEKTRGITALDKDLFTKVIGVHCLHCNNVKVSEVTPIIKKYLLKVEKFKPIQVNNEEIFIYLNPDKVNSWDSFSMSDRHSLGILKVESSNLEMINITLTYDNFSVEDILRAVLPLDVEGMSSFTKVGHIVHVNLRDHLLPYKNLIGEVLFDKLVGCKSVVNKIDMIDNTYRNFQMEVLCGTDDMKTSVKENNCIFEFDFSTVYWNSRLCTEHERIIQKIEQDSVLFDIFAGVGPFSIPVAKRKCFVFANDLNPESFKWLNHNVKKNKIPQSYIKTFNKDGHDFIRNELRELLPKYLNKNNIHIVMNLPGLAVEFISSFINLLGESEIKEIKISPTVHVYCFSKGEGYTNIAKNLVNKHMGFDISSKIIEITKVRTVSSLKEMMRVSFKLDAEILFGTISKQNCEKRKLEEDISPVFSTKKCNEGTEEKGHTQKGRSEKFEN